MRYRLSCDPRGFWWASREGADWTPLPITQGELEHVATAIASANLTDQAKITVVPWADRNAAVSA